MFSFYLTGREDDSYIDFGMYDKNVMVSEKDIVWLDVLKNDRWWTNYITGFKWSLYSNPILYSFDQTKAFTDTGTSCLIGPKDYVDWILDTLMDMLTTSKASVKWGTVFSCSEVSSLPSFYLLFGEHWFEVLPEDYTVATDGEMDECAFCLQGTTAYSYWILGDVFMRGWYSIHDYENMRFGFVPFKGSSKTVPEYVSDRIPTRDALRGDLTDGTEGGKKLKIWAIILLSVLGVIVIVFVVAFVKMKTKDDKPSKDDSDASEVD